MFSIEKKIFIFFSLFISLVISFQLGENSSGGSQQDYLFTKKYIDTFRIDLLTGLEMFKSRGEIHLPFFYILISNLNKVFGDTLVKYLYLIISSAIPLILYSALKKKFSQANIDHLFLLSLMVFLSPYFRSSAVWLTTDNLALLFFLLSINSFLKFENSKDTLLINAFLCFSFLILASYVRYYYSVFFVFYFYMMQSKLNFIQNFYIILYNLICSIPFLFYLKFFLKDSNTSDALHFVGFDFIFNSLIFASLFLFYFIPFLINRHGLKRIIKILKQNKKHMVIFILIIFLLFQFYEIPNVLFGGGIFYKISKFYNLNIFLIFSLFGIFLLYFFNDNIFRNSLIFLTLIFGFPITTLFQKYYDPLIYIIILTLINSKFINELIENKKINLLFLNCYYFIFLIACNFYYH